jgi:hypothetical protein
VAHQVHPVHLDLAAHQVQVEHLVLMDLPVHQVVQAQVAHQAQVVHLVVPDLLGQVDLPVHQVVQVQAAHQVHQVLVDQVVHLVLVMMVLTQVDGFLIQVL